MDGKFKKRKKNYISYMEMNKYFSQLLQVLK